MHRSLRFARTLALCGVSVVAAACASSPPPFTVRAAEFGKVRVPAGRPVVVALKAGERIPVVLDVNGEVVELAPNPSRLWLVAKRDFFVRFDGARVRTSLDGVHFDRRPEKPGSFRLGLGSDPAGGPRVDVAITTPVHAR